MSSGPKSRLEEVIEATDKLEQKLHEGRALLKDIKYERKLAEQVRDELKTAVVDAADQSVGEIVDATIQSHMEELGNVVTSTKDELHNRLISSFNELTNTLMYGSKNAKGKSNALVELLRQQGLYNGY